MSEREKIIDELLTRRVESGGLYPSQGAIRERLLGGAPVSVYWGVDPTAPEIHLGHTVALLFLKQLKLAGHQPVVLVGDFTARIGDPTDKTATRRKLTKEEIESNMEHYLEQITKVLPRDSFEVRHNSEWLVPMTLEAIIDITSRFTVQQMLVRDMFRERQKQEKPIFIHELLYPLMQGYDSVAMGIDGEVGGNDQTFNMLVGRDLVKEIRGKDKFVFALRLLTDGSGKKMSKSEGNLIAVNDEPQEIRRKILAIDDAMLRTVAELCTEKPYDWINERQLEGEKPKDPRAFKEELAEELVRMYHGAEAAVSTKEARRVSGRAGSLVNELLVAEGLVGSVSIGKRLIEQGGVSINGETVSNWKQEVKAGDSIQAGKGKFLEIES